MKVVDPVGRAVVDRVDRAVDRRPEDHADRVDLVGRADRADLADPADRRRMMVPTSNRLVTTCASFPSAVDLRAWQVRNREHPAACEMPIRLRASLQPGARTLSVRFPESITGSSSWGSSF